MMIRESLEPLKKEDIINLFVEFLEKVEKQIQQLQNEVSSLKVWRKIKARLHVMYVAAN